MEKSAKLQNIIQTIIKNEGLQNATVEYKNPDHTGYVCNVKIVNIKHSTSTLSLFLKHMPENHGEGVERICANECSFYKKVVPELHKIDPSINDIIPKCYYLDKELIILENLFASGFKIWSDLKIVLDEEHVVKVMETYGRFHALSTAVKLRSPETFKSLSSKQDCVTRSFKRYDEINLRKSAARIAANAFDNDAQESSAFLKFIDDEIYDFLDRMFKDDELDVIMHGDCWPHNYVFGYKDSKLNNAYLIDFQISFEASPIIDLSYFMCTSACSKPHFDKMETYLTHYYNAFSSQLRKLGFAQEEITTFETLQQHWKKYGKYGLIWGMFVNKMMTAEKDELEKHRQNEPLKGFVFISRNENLYHQRMRDSIGYFFENKCLNSML